MGTSPNGKPNPLTWSESVPVLVQRTDADRFGQLVEEFYQQEREAAVERTRERYAQAREVPDRMLSSDQAPGRGPRSFPSGRVPTGSGVRPGRIQPQAP